MAYSILIPDDLFDVIITNLGATPAGGGDKDGIRSASFSGFAFHTPKVHRKQQSQVDVVYVRLVSGNEAKCCHVRLESGNEARCCLCQTHPWSFSIDSAAQSTSYDTEDGEREGGREGRREEGKEILNEEQKVRREEWMDREGGRKGEVCRREDGNRYHKHLELNECNGWAST